MRLVRHFCRPSVVLFCTFLLLGTAAAYTESVTDKPGPASTRVWLMVDTQALTLAVMRADTVLRTFEDIAIGSNGVTLEKRSMDEKTPLGEFRINDIRTSQRYRLFLSIDYPNQNHARRALRDGRITAQEYQALQSDWQKQRTPSANTALGGNLGIHGLGSGRLDIHNRFNWTNGCIALNNEQIDELASLVVVGTPVVIR